MRALQIQAHGSFEELALRDVPEPPLAEGEVRVRVEAAGINPSDVGSLMGRFPDSPLPRILGRDFAGKVSDGPRELIGVRVYGSGGELGIRRDGTHAETLVIPRAAVAPRPSNLSPEQAAAVGVPFATAYYALELAAARAGELVVVSGAAGAVGTAAIQLAHARGAKTIAVVRNDAQAARLAGLGVHAIARTEGDDVAAIIRAATGGRGADVALDGVGGPVFEALVEALSARGRIAVYAASAGRKATIDIFDLYRRSGSILGVNTALLDVVRCAEIFRTLAPLFESGALRPPEITERIPLSEARAAYERVARGSAGKLVLVP